MMISDGPVMTYYSMERLVCLCYLSVGVWEEAALCVCVFGSK